MCRIQLRIQNKMISYRIKLKIKNSFHANSQINLLTQFYQFYHYLKFVYLLRWHYEKIHPIQILNEITQKK